MILAAGYAPPPHPTDGGTTLHWVDAAAPARFLVILIVLILVWRFWFVCTRKDREDE